MKRQAKSLQTKAKKHDVRPAGPGKFWAISATSGNRYLVSQLQNGGYACTCDWAKFHRTDFEPCSHVLAVQDYLEACDGRSLSFWADDESAERQHRPTERVGLGLWATSRIGA